MNWKEALNTIIFLAKLTSLNINCAVVCLSFAVSMARLGNVNPEELPQRNVFFFVYVVNEMLCTKHISVFSLGNNFPSVFLYLTRQYYMKTIPPGEDNNSIMVALRGTIQQKHRFTNLCSSCNMSGGNMLENKNICCRFISKESSINNSLAFRIFKTIIKS